MELTYIQWRFDCSPTVEQKTTQNFFENWKAAVKITQNQKNTEQND